MKNFRTNTIRLKQAKTFIETLAIGASYALKN